VNIILGGDDTVGLVWGGITHTDRLCHLSQSKWYLGAALRLVYLDTPILFPLTTIILAR
jgi:hypothetical protein